MENTVKTGEVDNQRPIAWKVTASKGESSLQVWNEGLNAAVGTILDLAPELVSGRRFDEITLTREQTPS